jgi:hypothetical protein
LRGYAHVGTDAGIKAVESVGFLAGGVSEVMAVAAEEVFAGIGQVEFADALPTVDVGADEPPAVSAKAAGGRDEWSGIKILLIFRRSFNTYIHPIKFTLYMFAVHYL